MCSLIWTTFPFQKNDFVFKNFTQFFVNIKVSFYLTIFIVKLKEAVDLIRNERILTIDYAQKILNAYLFI